MTDRSYRSPTHAGPGAQNRAGADVAPGKTTLVEQAFGPVARSAASPDKPRPGAHDALTAAAATSGQPLPGETRGKLEGAAGADLSSVRVHDKPESAAAAESVGAHAYAVGQDIHFAAGAYQPGTQAGQRLIAHEVAHTVQQQGASPHPRPSSRVLPTLPSQILACNPMRSRSRVVR